jgi:hypothetical protein
VACCEQPATMNAAAAIANVMSFIIGSFYYAAGLPP